MGTSPDGWRERMLPFVMVFGGCMSSMVFMEYVLQGDPDAGNLLNATEFVFVLVQSIPGRLQPEVLRRGLCFRPFVAPWSSHVQHALLWVTMSTMANVVFSYNIRIPIHQLFRSCNVISSVCIGRLVFGQRYTLRQLVCVIVITVGIFLGSAGDAQKYAQAGAEVKVTCVDCGVAAGTASPVASDTGGGGWTELGKWTAGITMLIGVQVLQATLGHVQAVFYRRYREQGSKEELSDEYLFTSHVASLCAILLLWQDIERSGRVALRTPPVAPWLPIPSRIGWMVLNNLGQLACIKGVFGLSSTYSPLTMNITLSVRKFGSLLVSALWFGNPWTHLHSVGAVAIFGGVFAYSQCPAPAPVADAKKDD